MAKGDIHVTVEGVGGGSKGPAKESNPGSSAPVSGVNKKEESTEEIFDRLSSSLTKDMKEMYNLLSGKEKGSTFASIRQSAEDLLSTLGLMAEKSKDEEESGASKKEGEFEKATKVMGLKPSDINIVDQQYILGSLLVNSTLLRIEDIMADYIKNQGKSSKKKIFGGKKGKGGDSEAQGVKAEAPKGKFAEGLSNFMNLMKTMPGLLVTASKEFKNVKWSRLSTSIKKTRLFIISTLPIVHLFTRNKKKFKTFNELVEPFTDGLVKLTKGMVFIGLMLPFIGLGYVSAKLIDKAMPTLIHITEQVDKNKKKFRKFQESAWLLSLGLMALVPGMVALAIMAPFLVLGVLSAALLIPTLLLLGIAIKFLPNPVTLLKGLLSALLLNLVVASLALSVIMIAPLGPKFKDTMIGLGTISIIAVAGTVLAALLGIPFILPLVAMGAITALALAVFFIGITVAAKAAIKAGKLAPEAARALGFISKKTANSGDNDGTEDKEESGIFAFLSKLASWTFFKILFCTIGSAALMAIVGGVLLFGALALTGALKQFDKIGKEIFPAGVEFSQTGPGSGVLGVIRFLRTITGRVDFNGNPVNDPMPIITWGDLFSLLPIVGFGILLKLSAKTLKGAMEEFAKISGDTNIAAAEEAVSKLKGFLRAADGLVEAAVGDDKPGLIGWILGFVFGESVSQGLTLLGKLFPLLMLGLYGKVLAMAVIPLNEGITALSTIDASKIDDTKVKKVVGVLDTVMDSIQSAVHFGTKESNYEYVANSVATATKAMVNVVDSIQILAGMSAKDISYGVAQYSYVIDQIFGTGSSIEWESSWGDGKLQMSDIFAGGLHSTKIPGTGLLGKLESIKGSAKVPTAVFEQITTVLDKIKPLTQAVIQMASYTPEQINQGVAAISTMFDLVQQLSGQNISEDAGGFMGVLNGLVDIAGTKAETNAMDHNPVFKMIEMFADLEKLEQFRKGADSFAKSAQVIIDVMRGLDTGAMETINAFSNSITNSGLGAAIDSTVRFIQAEAPLAKMANSFQSIANSLDRISDKAGALDALHGIGSINVGEVADAQAATNVNNQSAVMSNAMEIYVQRMSGIMEQWNATGIPIKQQAAVAAQNLAVEPSYNNVGNGVAFEGGF